MPNVPDAWARVLSILFLAIPGFWLGVIVAIVIEAALGFLVGGIPPPTPTWGTMLVGSLTSLLPHWWLVLFPGLAITLTVLAFNLFGDDVGDTMDPRLRGMA